MPMQELILRLRAEGGTLVVSELEGVGKATKEAEASVGSFGKTAEKSSKGTGMFHKSVGSLWGLMKSGAQLAGFAAIGSIGYEAIKNSQQLQVAQGQLGQAIHATGIYTRGASEQMQSYADSLAVKGGFAPPEAISAMSQFVRVTGDAHESMKDLNLATDIARARNIPDLTKVTRALMMAEQGRTTGLSRMGIVLPKNATAFQAMAILQQRYAGSTAAYAKTSTGAINTLRNTLEIATSRLGLMLAPTITKVAQAVSKFVVQIEDGKGAGGAFRDVVVGTVKALEPFVKLLWENKDVVAILVTAYIAYVTQQKLAALWTGLMKIQLGEQTIAQITATAATEGSSAAMAIFNAVLDANPIGAVIAAIALLVVGFYELYKHCKLVRDIVADVWKAIDWLINLIVKHWKIAVTLLLFVMTGGLGAVIFIIVSHFNQIVGFVKKLPGRIANAAKDIWNFLLHGITSIGSKVVDALIWPFKKAFKWVKDHLPSIHIHHIGPIPIPSIHIPGLQRGGAVRSPGPVIVGESGPEMLALPTGATVTPLTGRGGGAGSGEVVAILNKILAAIQLSTQMQRSVQIDGREVALQMARVGNMTLARQ